MDMKSILEQLGQGRDLSREQAAFAFGELLGGALTPAQAGGLLMALRTKGETPGEIAEAALAGQRAARVVRDLPGPRIDTCGTGGDNKHSFNCSTAVALYLAALGHKVVKHGNRAVSSSCGSADAVEGLGLPLGLEPHQVAGELERSNFAFLFAPKFHPAFAHIMPVRRELGVRTVFNLLGPLLNPALPTHQVLGVPKPDLVPLIADVLALTGCKRAVVVHGAGGYDELTPFGPNTAVWVREGRTEPGVIDPVELGVTPGGEPEIACGGKDEALSVLKAILTGGGPAAAREMVILNLGVALYLLDDGASLKDRVAEARQALDQGVARRFA